MDDCPVCGEPLERLIARIYQGVPHEFKCPRCGALLSVAETDEGLWVSQLVPEDQRLRQAGAPTLPGLE